MPGSVPLRAVEPPSEEPEGPDPAKVLRDLDIAIARLFANGRTYSEIAADLRTSRSTVARRMQQPETKMRVRVEVDRRVSDIVNSLNGAASSAVLVLQKVMVDPKASDAAKVRAADSLLSHLGRFSLRGVHDPVTLAEARMGLTAALQDAVLRKREGTPTVDQYLADDPEPETDNKEGGTADADE